MRPNRSSSAVLAILSCGVLVLMFVDRVWAQSAPQQDPPAASAASAQTNPPPEQNVPEAAPPSDDSVSLADAARLARANKGTPTATAKAAKKYDDDNFPRSTPIVKKNTSDSAPADPSIQNLPLDQMKGKVVLLDFWASWCGPCRMALPKLKQLRSVYSSDDLVVVSVSEDDDQATWRAFVADHAMTWTQKFDGNSALLRKYQISGLPTYVLLDRDGNEVQRYEGEDPGQSIIERAGPDIKRALESRQSASN